MPVIKSAKKKLRKDKKITAQNNKLRVALKKVLKETSKKPSEVTLKKAVQLIDKAAKKNIVHRNKAARLKSKLTRLVAKKPGKAPVSKPQKTEKPAKKVTSKTKAKK
jgi:small subunit ribosomal protein S20